MTVPTLPRALGDRDLPSSLNRTRSPTLNLGKLKGPPQFIRRQPNSTSRRMAEASNLFVFPLLGPGPDLILELYGHSTTPLNTSALSLIAGIVCWTSG